METLLTASATFLLALAKLFFNFVFSDFADFNSEPNSLIISCAYCILVLLFFCTTTVATGFVVTTSFFSFLFHGQAIALEAKHSIIIIGNNFFINLFGF